jgi:predicted patatin/cPLA2 family phospholipase
VGDHHRDDVGYGAPPHTTAGKVIAVVLMVVGVGFVAILTAAAADRLIHARNQEADQIAAIHAGLDQIAARLDAAD